MKPDTLLSPDLSECVCVHDFTGFQNLDFSWGPLGSFAEVQEFGSTVGTGKLVTDPHLQLRRGEREVAVKAGTRFKRLG